MITIAVQAGIQNIQEGTIERYGAVAFPSHIHVPELSKDGRNDEKKDDDNIAAPGNGVREDRNGVDGNTKILMQQEVR